MPAYSFWIDVAVAIKCFGVATSYLIVIGLFEYVIDVVVVVTAVIVGVIGCIGDLMPDFMEQCGVESGVFHSREFWVLIGWIMCAVLTISFVVYDSIYVWYVFFYMSFYILTNKHLPMHIYA